MANLLRSFSAKHLCMVLLTLQSVVTPATGFRVNTDNWVSLTYPLSTKTPVNTMVYSPLVVDAEKSIASDSWPGTPLDGTYAAFRYIELYEHTGTHVDAPAHFTKGGRTEEQLTWDELTGPVVVIDVSHKVREAGISNYPVTGDDLQEFIDTHGPIEPKSFVLLNTGWGQYFFSDGEKFEKEATCISESAIDWLLENAGEMLGFGMDVISPECNDGGFFRLHTTILPRGQLIIENVMSSGMSQLPPKGAYLLMFPMHLEGATGSPVRMVAITEGLEQKNDSSQMALSKLAVAVTVFMSIAILL